MRQVYYNVYDYGRRVGTYATMDIQTMLHCSRQVPEHCAADGKAYRGRYTGEIWTELVCRLSHLCMDRALQ